MVVQIQGSTSSKKRNELLYQLTLIILSWSSDKISNAIKAQNNESTNKGQMFSGITFNCVANMKAQKAEAS